MLQSFVPLTETVSTVKFYANIYRPNWSSEMWFLYTCRTVWHRCVFVIHRENQLFKLTSQVCETVLCFCQKCICFNLFLTTSDTSLNQISDTLAYWLCVRSNYAHHLLLPFLSSFGHSASRPRDKQMQVILLLLVWKIKTLFSGFVWNRTVHITSGLICKASFCQNAFCASVWMIPIATTKSCLSFK